MPIYDNRTVTYLEKTITRTGEAIGIYKASSYYNNSGGIVSNDAYWNIMGPIDVLYEASLGGSVAWSGLTFGGESNRTNIVFYDSAYNIVSVTYYSANSGSISVPNGATYMCMCIRIIGPNDMPNFTLTWRVQYAKGPNLEIDKLYEFDGTNFNQINKVYDNDNLIYKAETPIYESGVSNTDLIGSWITNKCIGGGTVTFNSDHLLFSYSNNPNTNQWSNGIIWTSNKVNLSGYSKLCATVTGCSRDVDANLILNNAIYSGDNPDHEANCVTVASITSNGTITLDLTNYQSSYYIAVHGKPNGGWYCGGSHTVTKVWLE